MAEWGNHFVVDYEALFIIALIIETKEGRKIGAPNDWIEWMIENRKPNE